MSIEDFEIAQAGRFSQCDFYTTLVVQVVDVLHKYRQGQTRPLILKCRGRGSQQRIAIAAFNIYHEWNHNTAFDLLARLEDISGYDIIGTSFVFKNLSLHPNPSCFAVSDGIDGDLVIAHYEKMTNSFVNLLDDGDPYSDLRLWKASNLVDIPRAWVTSIYYHSEGYNRCRLVLKLNIGGRSFLAISYLWDRDYARDMKGQFCHLKRTNISIRNATLLRHPLYGQNKFTLGLRRNAVIEIYAEPEEEYCERIMFIGFDCSHHDEC